MTSKELIKLKSAMPPKYRDTLALKFGVSTTYIDMIFRGTHVRHDVIDIAIELALDHKQKLEEQKAKIKSL